MADVLVAHKKNLDMVVALLARRESLAMVVGLLEFSKLKKRGPKHGYSHAKIFIKHDSHFVGTSVSY